jgi:hypothetical protein
MRKLIISFLVLGVTTAVATTLSPASAEVYITPKLTVGPTYSGLASLSAATIESTDALATYTPTLTEVATGRPIALGYGSAYRTDPYSDYEGPYNVPTAEPLVVGVAYLATLRVQTVGYWSCSIYNPDVCSWRDPADDTYRWTFTYSGASQQAQVYYLPMATSATLVRDFWKKKADFAVVWGHVGLKYPCAVCGPRRPLTVQGLYNDRWFTLATGSTDIIDEYAFRLRIKYKYRKLRVSVPEVSEANPYDGGTQTFTSVISNSVRVPKRP